MSVVHTLLDVKVSAGLAAPQPFIFATENVAASLVFLKKWMSDTTSATNFHIKNHGFMHARLVIRPGSENLDRTGRKKRHKNQ